MRGWLLACVDGQTTGLVPANYVKVLGKRRGRKQAEMERLAQVQTGLAAEQQSNPGQGAASAAPAASPEELLESVYIETPASCSSSVAPNTAVNIPEKTDL